MPEQRSNPYRRPRPDGDKTAGKPRGLRELPRDLHDLADGRVDRLKRPRRPPPSPLEDDQGRHVIPGVRNSESRTVYDRRVLALRGALQRDDTDALGVGLYEAQCLGLWRARNITDFEAFAENVVGIQTERAHSLVDAASARAGHAPMLLGHEVIALWVRTEAALVPLCADAIVHVSFVNDAPWIQVHLPALPVVRAVDALKSIGPGLSGLGRLIASGAKPPERRE